MRQSATAAVPKKTRRSPTKAKQTSPKKVKSEHSSDFIRRRWGEKSSSDAEGVDLGASPAISTSPACY
jgi:hypothetical protein